MMGTYIDPYNDQILDDGEDDLDADIWTVVDGRDDQDGRDCSNCAHAQSTHCDRSGFSLALTAASDFCVPSPKE